MVSTPLTVKCALHGAPVGSLDRSAGQTLVMLPNTDSSLPPMPSVTRSVPPLSASNCGGLLPTGMPARFSGWGWVRFVVDAPEQLTSVSEPARSAPASSDG